jgi:hypothetical protein
MKTDAYTKAILTIIAVCLVILAAKSFDSGLVVSTAHAETKNIMDVNIVQINGEGVNTGSKRQGCFITDQHPKNQRGGLKPGEPRGVAS